MGKSTGMSIGQMFNQQSPAVSSLSQRIQDLEAEILELKQNSSPQANDTELQQKVAELTSILEQIGGKHRIPVKLVHPDPNQPRTVFSTHAIKARAKSMRDEGQLAPIIVTPLPDGTFLLFEGELRWRSSEEAGFSELDAVLRPPSESETKINRFRQQLATSLSVETLHPFDVANGLVRLILDRHPDLEGNVSSIPKHLNAVIARLRRNGKASELESLRYESIEVQQTWIETNDFRKVEERTIVAEILKQSINPVYVSVNIFPLLGLPEDLQTAIRQHGIEASKILEIKKVTAAELEKTRALQPKDAESEAVKIRKRIVQQIVDQPLSLATVKKLVQDELTPHPESLPTSAPVVNKVQRQLDAIAVPELDETSLKQMEKMLKAKLKEVTDQLKNRKN